MRVALDATYSGGAEPSGIAVYSRELLRNLPILYPDEEYLACWRPKQWRTRIRSGLPNVRARVLQWPLPVGRPNIFHALNQRADWRPARYVVTTFHDLFVMSAEYSTTEFRERFTKRARRAADYSDLIIAVSQFTADQVHDLLNVERSRIRVIHHGVHQASLDFPACQREPVILFVGALQSRKNIVRLIEGFEQTRPEWRLVLAGSGNGFGAEAIRLRVKQSPRQKQIELAGYVDERRLLELYAKASIFAFPSLDEGFGIPILEAMQRGVPVLTSQRSAMAEVAGDAAHLVDPEDANTIGEGLRLLGEDAALRTRLITSGHLRARQFPWSLAARQTHEVYRELTR